MIDLQLKDGVYEAGLAHPPINEIGTEMLEALEELLAKLNTDEAHALVLYSKEPRGFCAGADLRELQREITGTNRPLDEQRAELASFLDRIHAVMNALDTLPLTTVGAIQGVCFGGGFELALTCDVLVADPTARFCFPELRLGIIPGFGGIPRLKRDVGNAIVRDLLLTGRSINARKAQGCGLVSQLVGRGEALEAARRVATQAGRFDPTARRTAKTFIKPIPLAELEAEKAHFLELFFRPTVAQALTRFVESDDIRPYLPGA